MRIPLLELRRIATAVRADGRRTIALPRDSAAILGPLLRGLEVEVALALLLDGRHRPIGVVEVARGGANVVHLSPRDLFRVAIHAGAVAVVLAHSHPSGDVLPSTDDVALTSRMRAAGELLGVPMLDHLVVTDDEVFSFTARRLERWSAPPADATAPRLVAAPVASVLVAATHAAEE